MALKLIPSPIGGESGGGGGAGEFVLLETPTVVNLTEADSGKTYLDLQGGFGVRPTGKRSARHPI